MKKYSVRSNIPEEKRQELSEYSDLVSHLLYHRGIETSDDAQAFLNPDYETHTHDPYLLKDMQKVVDRIFKAIDTQEKIVIYSDYDHDGLPGAVVLHDTFKKIGYTNFVNYVPHRNKEGFGLNISAIDSLHAQGATLFITIDCGIADVDEIAYAQEKGIDVIVTDHHEVPDVAPKAFAIINPKQVDCEYPEPMLCGAGVIFKVATALIQTARTKGIEIPEGWEKWLLDMVGIATLSDMVPLRGENRVFAYYGMIVLKKTPRISLRTIFRKNNVRQQDLVEDDIIFSVTPKINAASRMGIPMDAFKLLTAQTQADAEYRYKHLEDLNKERRTVVASMTKQAHGLIAQRFDKEKPNVIVLGNPDWKPSLVGLVASTLSEEFGCPVFVWGRESGTSIKGSCRSGDNVSVFEIMNELPEGVLSAYGGHEAAGGFVVNADQVHFLHEKIVDAYKKLKEKDVEDRLELVDIECRPEDVIDEMHNQMLRLAPFGIDNHKPLIALSNAIIEDVVLFGKQKNHLKITVVRKGMNPLSAIAFFKDDTSFGKKIEPGMPVTIYAHIERDMFLKRGDLRLKIVDIL